MSSALLAAALAACGTTPVAPTPAEEGARWLAGQYPAGIGPATHLVAVGRGATPGEARAAALAELVRPLGPPAPVVEAVVAAAPLVEKHATANGAPVVLLAATRGPVAARLAEAAAARTPVPRDREALAPPALLAHHLAAARARSERAALCSAAAALGAAPCAATDETTAGSLTALADALELRQIPSEGVPHRPHGPALRPVVVVALHRSAAGETPWSGLPLVVTAPPDLVPVVRIATDAQGRVALPLARPLQPSDAVSLDVDRQALLGEHAALWPPRPLAIRFRPLALHALRVGLNVTAAPGRDMALAAYAFTQVREALLARNLGITLVDAATPGSAATRPDPAADVTIEARIDWAFASAFGARSVWYEATGRLALMNTWSGESLLAKETRAQEAGIGEDHAARQSLRKLAATLAGEIEAALKAAFGGASAQGSDHPPAARER